MGRKLLLTSGPSKYSCQFPELPHYYGDAIGVLHRCRRTETPRKLTRESKKVVVEPEFESGQSDL